jgi:hypothetical protein
MTTDVPTISAPTCGMIFSGSSRARPVYSAAAIGSTPGRSAAMIAFHNAAMLH